MQSQPLLENLDWFFTSASRATTYLATVAIPLAKTVSIHLPCVIKIDSKIPKSKIFRFENHWMQHSDFNDIVMNA